MHLDIQIFVIVSVRCVKLFARLDPFEAAQKSQVVLHSSSHQGPPGNHQRMFSGYLKPRKPDRKK